MKINMRMVAILSGCFLYAVVATAQTPLSPESVPADLEIDAFVQDAAFVSCDGTSQCALTWGSFTVNNQFRQWGRIISPQGILAPIQDLGADSGLGIYLPTVPVNPGFLLFGQRGFQTGVFGFWRYDENLHPQGDFVHLPFHGPARYGDTDSLSATGFIEAIPAGFVECQLGYDQPEEPCSKSSCVGVFLYFFDRAGNKLRDRVQVNQDTTYWETNGPYKTVAVDGTGNIIVTFTRIYDDTIGGRRKSFARRFTPAGVPASPEIEVTTDLPGNQVYPSVAASPDGEFLIAWLNQSNPLIDSGEIYGRRFSANGVPIGPAFRISAPIPAQSQVAVIADRQGNYFVAWDSLQELGYDVRGRLYRHDGRPVARDFRVNQEVFSDQILFSVAFAPNGTLTTSYSSDSPNQTHGFLRIPVIRRYAASPGQEPCAVAGSRLLCDTGRTGGFPELDTSFGGRPGEVTLLGDWDGDGRDDVCAWRAGRFRCDLDHEGPPAEAALQFGLPNDVPLLGDVDGDGRAEPCVRRKRRLLCDTGRDGGRAETTVVLGSGTEAPLLGDLDGDGKDDLCLFQQGQWLCKTRQDVILRRSFGGPGDLPALGDLNRDGRADFCAFRDGTLSCDTAREGATALQKLEMSLPPGARPLFGNLDGL